MNSIELPPVPDNYDELWEGEPHKAALLRKLRARAQTAEAAGQPFEGLQLTDYTEAITEYYESSEHHAYALELIREILRLADSNAWEDLADINTDPLRLDGYGTPGSWLTERARELAAAQAYARAHGLEPLAYEEAARIWTETYREAYERTPPRTARSIQQLRASAASALELETPKESAEAVQNLINKFRTLDASDEHAKVLAEAGIVAGHLVLSMEVNPVTLRPVDAEAAPWPFSYPDTGSGKLYAPADVRSLWRAPAGKIPPPHFDEALLNNPRTAAAVGMGDVAQEARQAPVLTGGKVTLKSIDNAPALTPRSWELERLSLLTMQPMQTIDRATRSPSGWRLGADRLPRFNDPRSPLFVEYQRDGATAEALAEGVNRLNPRTADVWRLITARSLEAWPLGQDRPPSVWLDVRELADAMGYKKHHKGGHKPEHIAEVVRAVHDLDALYINLPLGTQVYQAAKPGSKRRTPTKLEALRRLKVLLIRGNDEVRNLFGDSWPLRYKLEPGDWIELYPRSYAPLFKALVELPAKAGASTWAKAIGTELLFQYRQNTKNSSGVERLKVRTLLERAGRLEEATESRNKSRMRTYFEEALDLLKAEEVCAGWEYEPKDSDQLEAVAGARGWFAGWLECRVLITTPDNITNELQATSGAAMKAQRAQQKRRLSDTN